MELTELRNLYHMIKYAAEEYGNTDFLLYKQNNEIASKTYKDLLHFSEVFCTYIKSKGLDCPHIAIVGPTSFEWIVSYFGTVIGGGATVPLAPAETTEMNCKLIDFADVSVLVFDSKHKAIYNETKDSGRIKLYISIDNSSDSDDIVNISDILNTNTKVQIPEPDSDELCSIVFTSGTTGFPKGVMLTHKNLVMSAASVHQACPTKKMFCCLPVHHMFSFTANITKSICRGKTVCLNDNIQNIVQDLRLYRPDSIIAVPQLVKKLMEGAIRFAASKPELSEETAVKMFFGGNIIDIISGGAPLDAASNERYNKTGILVLNGYGMTECSPIISNNAVGNFRHGSIGKPIPCMDVKIVNNEIMCKGPSVMKGYYKNPEATKAAFDENGYLHTGDIGHFDEDGFLYITGRCKNLILLDNGENVSAEMLEDRFGAETLIKEVICFGENGAIYAEVYPDKERMLEKGVADIEDEMPAILSRVNAGLATYQKISGYIIRETPFERTASSKIKRGNHGKVEKKSIVAPSDEKEQKVYDTVKELLSLKEISMTDNFFLIGGNSLNAVELAATLNIKVQSVYDNPYLNELSSVVSLADNGETDRVEGINDLISSIGTEYYQSDDCKGILFTGATGFLGIHILRILAEKKKKVFCLVRNADKLKKTATEYFEEFDFSDITCVIGDIEKDNLGLASEEYAMLLSEVDCVYHIAANVTHSGDYNDLERTNVIGTKNIISFCLKSGAVLHHTSTVSLHGAGTCKQSRTDVVSDENTLDIGQFYCDNVYIHSKYIAEQEVILARKEGLKANIYRIGNLTWRTTDGQFQLNADNNGFMHRLRGMLKLGLYHDNMEKYPIDMTAVNECAEAYVKLAENGTVNQIYHLYNPNYLSVRDMFSYFGIAERYVSTFETIETMFANSDDRDIHVYLFYMMIAARSENIVMSAELTTSELKKCGFAWSTPDKDYMLLSGINTKEFATIKAPRHTGGALNPIQKIILGALKQAKPFNGNVISGAGKIVELKNEADKLNIIKPLIIAIPKKFRSAELSAAIDTFENAVVFSEINGEPTVNDCEKVFGIYCDNNCDGVIAVGGGSVLDIAKVVSLRASNCDRNPEDICKIYARVNKNVPFIAVPTTAGTGSEATIFAVLTDTTENRKKAFTSDKFYPHTVILDPALTKSVPSMSTAFMGIDALSHIIESSISLFEASLSDDSVFAEEAIRLIFASLYDAVSDGENISARENMQRASFLAGRCFGRISTGYVHAIAHRLGEIYHIPHGYAIACCLAPVLKSTLPYGADKLKNLYIATNGDEQVLSTQQAAEAFIASVDELIRKCGIDTHPDVFDINDAKEITMKAQDEIKALGCPRPFTDNELETLVLTILKGE